MVEGVATMHAMLSMKQTKQRWIMLNRCEFTICSAATLKMQIYIRPVEIVDLSQNLGSFISEVTSVASAGWANTGSISTSCSRIF